MAAAKGKPIKHAHHHKDGSLRAEGWLLDGVMTGYWEWFRKDGSKMRSGYFDNGEQTGEWTTYDRDGEIFKVSQIETKTQAKKS